MNDDLALAMAEARDEERKMNVLWEKLREPFTEDEIELLPKYVGPMKDVNGKKVPANDRQRCDECGGFHAFPCVHLHYIGHAGITMRLNDVVGPMNWSLTPFAIAQNGAPLLSDGGAWFTLEILGIKKLCFGDAQGKTGPSAIKEIIGDAIRNGCMRFGIGTYLWSKSEKAKAILIRGIQGDDDTPETPPGERLADESILEQIRALRTSLGVSDEKYAGQLTWAQESAVTKDTELTAKAAAKLLSALEDKAEEVARAAKDAADVSAAEVLDSLGATVEVEF